MVARSWEEIQFVTALNAYLNGRSQPRREQMDEVVSALRRGSRMQLWDAAFVLADGVSHSSILGPCAARSTPDPPAPLRSDRVLRDTHSAQLRIAPPPTIWPPSSIPPLSLSLSHTRTQTLTPSPSPCLRHSLSLALISFSFAIEICKKTRTHFRISVNFELSLSPQKKKKKKKHCDAG